jgi:periplasmic protein CpxP/Spy
MLTVKEIDMTKTKLLTFTVLPVALGALALGCGGPHHRGQMDPARMDHNITDHIEDYLDDAKASDAQRTKILAVKNRLLPEGVALATAHQKLRLEIAQQLASDRPDTARLHTLVDQQIEAARAFAHKSVDGVVEVHGTLTPEQRAPLTKKLRRYASR